MFRAILLLHPAPASYAGDVLPLVIIGVGAALVARARGGSFEALAATEFRVVGLLVGGLALQVVFTSWHPEWISDRMTLAIIVWSNAAVILFIVLNRRFPGTMLMAAGLALNILVIAANGAMPVSERAVEVAKAPRAPNEASIEHEILGPHTVLGWLGDVVPIPRGREVLSIGDLLLIAGIGRLVYVQTRARTPSGW